ncbi:MAG: hypothetical protein ACNA7K_06640 [Acholeplasmataceae bacterium]
MKQMIVLLLLLMFVTGCAGTETPIETNEETPIPSEPTPTPELDPTLSDAFVFYKSFLNETIRDPMLSPEVIYDFPDFQTSIAKADFMETYESLDQNYVTTDYYNIYVTDGIYHFDRHIEACDLTGILTSCMTFVQDRHVDYNVLFSAELSDETLSIEIKMIYLDSSDAIFRVYHRFITFDNINGNVSIEYAELVYEYIDDVQNLISAIYGSIIENESFNFVVKLFNTADVIKSTLLHQVDLVNQTHLIYRHNIMGETIFQHYNQEDAYFLSMTLEYEQMIAMNLHFLEGANVLLIYEEFYLRENATMYWNLLEVDDWTHLLCIDCNTTPTGLQTTETILPNADAHAIDYRPTKRIPVYLEREATEITEAFVSLNDIGLDFTKVSATDLESQIALIKDNYEDILLQSGFTFGQTDYATPYDDMLAYYIAKSMASFE